MDTLDGEAARFYLHHDFRPVKGTPQRLIMTMATARAALGVGIVTVAGDHATRLMSLVFNTPEGKTIPVVLSTAEIRTLAGVLETIEEPELSEEALRASIIAAIGRDPFDEA